MAKTSVAAWAESWLVISLRQYSRLLAASQLLLKLLESGKALESGLQHRTKYNAPLTMAAFSPAIDEFRSTTDNGGSIDLPTESTP
jgi:hypothetical protein